MMSFLRAFRRCRAVAAVAVCIPAIGFAQLVDIATDATDPGNLSDAEPSIAVNPANPLEIVVVTFCEGWGPDEPAPIWRSLDGGVTWTKDFQLPQPLTNSSGPGDQKLAFDAAGRLRVAELAQLGGGSFIFSQNGAVGAPLGFGMAFGDDQPHLDVDRSAGSSFVGRVYAPWLDFGQARQRSTVTNSVDAGATVTNVGAGDNSTFNNRTTRIALGPDGKAYIIYKTREGAASGMFEPVHFRVNRSDDGGATWNAIGAAGVSVHGSAQVETFFTTSWGNSSKGRVARARSSDAWIAADPGDGDVYAAFVKKEASGLGQIFVSRSTDDGVTWANTRVSDGKRHAAFPEVAVADNGTVGVLYIEFDDSGARTKFLHRFARSFDNGKTWTNQTLQSMDVEGMPAANAVNGFLWGDYEGLTALGNTFYGCFCGESINRTTRQLDPIFFKSPATAMNPVPCIRDPNRCFKPRFDKGLIGLRVDIPGGIIVDPVPENCKLKWDGCPGCGGGVQLCPPWYNMVFEDLDPRIWDVALFDRAGQHQDYRISRTEKRTVLSFRPDKRHFKDGSIGDFFLAFELIDKRGVGREFSIRTHLEVADKPFANVVTPRRVP